MTVTLPNMDKPDELAKVGGDIEPDKFTDDEWEWIKQHPQIVILR